MNFRNVEVFQLETSENEAIAVVNGRGQRNTGVLRYPICEGKYFAPLTQVIQRCG